MWSHLVQSRRIITYYSADVTANHWRWWLRNRQKGLTTSHKAESQAMECFIPRGQVILDGIDDQSQELIFLQAQCNICSFAESFTLDGQFSQVLVALPCRTCVLQVRCEFSRRLMQSAKSSLKNPAGAQLSKVILALILQKADVCSRSPH